MFFRHQFPTSHMQSVVTVHLSSRQLHLKHGDHMWLRAAVPDEGSLEEACDVLRSGWERKPCPQGQKTRTANVK